MKKILIADDQQIVREGVKIVLTEDYPEAAIFEAHNAATVLEMLRAQVFDLIILDLKMPDTDAGRLIVQIRQDAKRTGILVYSFYPEVVFAKRYLQLGVSGYLNKYAELSELRKAVKIILDNGKYISPSINQQLVDEAIAGASHNPFDRLSGREKDILFHVMKGQAVKHIAKVLHLQSSTVTTYKARIFKKLNVSNIIELRQLARVYSLLDA